MKISIISNKSRLTVKIFILLIVSIIVMSFNIHRVLNNLGNLSTVGIINQEKPLFPYNNINKNVKSDLNKLNKEKERQKIQNLKVLIKPDLDLKKELGNSFFDSINYLSNIKNTTFDWTSALPISPPPVSVKKAGAQSFLFDDLHHYSPSNGDYELRKAIISKFRKDGIKADHNNILVHTSVFEILENIYFTVNWAANDSILIPVPTFGYYASQAAYHKIKVQFIKTSQQSNWKINSKDLDEALQKTKSKIFLFTNPVNPTGVVYTKEEVEKLAQVFKKHGTIVIADEIFKDIILKGEQTPFSIGAIEGMEDLTITLNGVGKSMGLAGLRVSYAHVPHWLITKLPKPLCGLSKPAEKAAIEALKDNLENRTYFKKVKQKYIEKTDTIKTYLKIIDKELNRKFTNKSSVAGSFAKLYLEAYSTNVALLQFPGVKGKFTHDKQINTSLDLAYYLYEKAGVALVPGEASFIEGKEMVLRIPLSAKNLKEGLAKIKTALLHLDN